MKKLIFLFLLISFRTVNAQICFDPVVTYTPTGQSVMCVDDFNQDGKPDIASFGTGHLYVYLGTGTGTFGSPNIYTCSTSATSITSGDFDGDGNKDIAVPMSLSGQVAVYLGTGTGTFGSPVNSPTGYAPRNIVCADFNNDGKLDVVTSYDGGSTIYLSIGDGSGGFAPAISYTVGTNPYRLCAGDFNSDGTPDCAVGNINSANVSVLLSTGSGTFNSPVNFSVGSGNTPYQVITKDFNADGKLDLAAVNTTNSITIMLGNGNGGFSNGGNYSIGNNPDAICSADFNGDTVPDLAVCNYNTNNVSVILGTGTGSFGTITNLSLGSATSPISIATADFNGDGKPDIAVPSSSGTGILLNALPFISVAGTTSMCAGDTVTLKASGATTYTWSANAGSATIDSVLVHPGVTTTYSVSGKTGACTATRSITVTVNPTLSITGSTAICSGNSSVLTANGAASYTWMPGNVSTATLSVAPLSSTTYTLTGNSGICTNTKTVTVTVSATPTVNVTGNNNICSGMSTVLTASGATSYTWIPGNFTGTSHTFTPTSTTVYTVTGKAGSCSASQVFTVSVAPTPTLGILGNMNICTGSSTILSATGATSYTWSPVNLYTDSITVSPGSTSTYTLLGNANGCVSSTAATVTVNPLPNVVANASQMTVCAGQSVTLSGGGASSYTWTGGVGDGIAFVPSATQDYTVSGTDNNNCVNSATITIAVNSLPNVTANASATSICNGDSIILTGSGAVSYSWSGGVSNGIAFSPASSQTFTVTGTDSAGCVSSNTVAVSVEYCVWPGDADENLIVDNSDLFPVGIKFGETGPVRSNPDNLWSGHLAYDWSDTLMNSKNVKYSDCNGDGLIDMNDTLAIDLNYGNTHAARLNPGTAESSAPDLFLLFNKSFYYPGDTVYAFVHIGNSSLPQTNFYGAAFTLYYDKTKVQAGTEEFYYNNSWVGNINQSKIKLAKLFPTAGKVDASLVRITHTDTSGYGKVATLKFILSDSLDYGTLYFTLSNAVKTDHVGNMVPLNSGIDSVTTMPQTTGINKTSTGHVILYPNPARHVITLQAQSGVGQVRIYNSLGEIIVDEFIKESNWSLTIRELRAGIYSVCVKDQVIRFIKE